MKRPGLGMMAVIRYSRRYFDPAFLEGRDAKHLAFVVLHEAIHVFGRHAHRSMKFLAGRPPEKRLGIWRQAVDASVNATVPWR
jgi:predicted metal-dependent peptidase